MTWLDVFKFIGRLIWTAIRITLVLFLAIVLGGFRGATKARMKTASHND